MTTNLGRKFTTYRLHPEDLEWGEFKSPWIPAYAPDLPFETMRDVVVPFISGWALGTHRELLMWIRYVMSVCQIFAMRLWRRCFAEPGRDFRLESKQSEA